MSLSRCRRAKDRPAWRTCTSHGAPLLRRRRQEENVSEKGPFPCSSWPSKPITTTTTRNLGGSLGRRRWWPLLALEGKGRCGHCLAEEGRTQPTAPSSFSTLTTNWQGLPQERAAKGLRCSSHLAFPLSKGRKRGNGSILVARGHFYRRRFLGRGQVRSCPFQHHSVLLLVEYPPQIPAVRKRQGQIWNTCRIRHVAHIGSVIVCSVSLNITCLAMDTPCNIITACTTKW